MSYKFNNIKVIGSDSDLINIALSKKQGQKATIAHPVYAISNIRSIYIEKIRSCQQNISQKLCETLENFPKIQHIHPFYADLFNVLYDRHQYQQSLNHLQATKIMVQNLSKKYLQLVKNADSLYRCKQLKKTALGRMCTMIQKISLSLSYLQQVRKHLQSLPNINPHEKTLLIFGYPNVGKSSFMNALSNENVTVQPYPFTTQGLYSSYTDFGAVKFQVIDSPGVLHDSLQKMNSIQMQSITALAHLKNCVLYMIDPSEQCGFSVTQQFQLYSSLKPLLNNKPVLVVLTKKDLKTVPQTNENKAVMKWIDEFKLDYTQISTLTGQNITETKQMACQKLMKIQSQNNKLIKMVDSSEKTKETVKQIQQQNEGIILKEYKPILQDQNDQQLQIYNDKNIADFVSVDILVKLNDLQKQQDLMFGIQKLTIQNQNNAEDEIISDKIGAYEQIKIQKHSFCEQNALSITKNTSKNDINFGLASDEPLIDQKLMNKSQSIKNNKNMEERAGKHKI